MSFLKYLSIALGASLGVSNFAWYVAYNVKDDALVRSLQEHTETINKYEKAQLKAEVKSLREIQTKEEESRKNAEESNQAYGDLLSKYKSSLVRLQEAQSRRPSSGFDLSSTTTTSDGTNTESESSKLSIRITLPDAEICAENTARLVTIHDWYEKTYKK